MTARKAASPPADDDDAFEVVGRRRKPPLGEVHPGPCPVTILGHDAGRYFFLSPSPEGQFRPFGYKDLSQNGMLSLFGSRSGWLVDRFPQRDEDGKPLAGRWTFKAAQQWLFREAHDAGLFAPARHIRGPGAWRGDDGALIVHCGDKLLIGGECRPAGAKVGSFIYPAGPAETRPAERPASAEQATEALDLLGAWAWRAPVHAPRLLLGWVASAMIAGALVWRPHVQITAPQGAGKSTLLELVRGWLGSVALDVSAPTEAGIRQALAGAARPVLVDEMETDDPARARRVVELARLASTDGQGDVVRGSVGGTATLFPVRACFLFSAILHIRFRPQDLARICVLEFDHAPAGETADVEPVQVKLRADVRRLGALGPALRRRMIEGWDRFVENRTIYEAAIAELGSRARVADQLGTLLAAAETLLSDRPATIGEARRLVADFSVPDIVGHDDEDEQTDARDHLLSSEIAIPNDERGGTGRRLLGEIVAETCGRPGGWRADLLRRHGLAVVQTEIAVEGRKVTLSWLAVANRHRGLDAIFANTRWADGAWKLPLRRVAGATASADKISFGGLKSRAVLLPWAALELPEPSRRADEGPI